MGMPLDGILSCLFKIVNSPPSVATFLKMHCQFAGYLSCSLTIGGLFAFANASMEPNASSCCHPLVHDILVQRMNKTVPAGDRAIGPLFNSCSPDKLAFCRQAGAALFNSLDFLCESRSHRGHRELHPRNTADREYPLFLRV